LWQKLLVFRDLACQGEDVATVPEKAERMHDRIEGSEMVVIPGAGHTASLEEPDAVNAAMQDFLARQ